MDEEILQGVFIPIMRRFASSITISMNFISMRKNCISLNRTIKLLYSVYWNIRFISYKLLLVYQASSHNHYARWAIEKPNFNVQPNLHDLNNWWSKKLILTFQIINININLSSLFYPYSSLLFSQLSFVFT